VAELIELVLEPELEAPPLKEAELEAPPAKEAELEAPLNLEAEAPLVAELVLTFLSAILTNPSWTSLVSVYPMGPAE